MTADKLRVLWIINKTPPAVAAIEGRGGVRGAWLDSYIEVVGGSNQYDLTVAFPCPSSGTMPTHIIDGIRYCGLPVPHGGSRLTRILHRWKHEVVSTVTLDAIRELVGLVRPELIHLHGAEDGYGLALLESAVPRVLSIQGSPTSILPLYVRGIDRHYLATQSLYDFIRGTGAVHHHLMLEARSRAETEIMNACSDVIGRTDWDRRVCSVLAPDARYHHCDEPMRLPFHQKRWSANSAVSNRVLALVGQYPCKGVGTMLKAFEMFSRRTPGAELVLVGLVRGSDHERAAERHIRRSGLGTAVRLTGEIDAEMLVSELLACSIFVNPSHIENGSNALSEAMLLGVPCVASACGGMMTTAQYGRGALLVQDGDVEALAGALLELNRDAELASSIGAAGRQIAGARHDRDAILRSINEIYASVSETSVERGANR